MPYHHGDLRAALVAATRRTLRDSPTAAISIRAVAREVGVSANAPYRHFGDRDALLRAVITDGYRTTAARLSGGKGAGRVAEVWTDLAADEPALVALMTGPLAQADADPDLAAAIGEWLGQVTRAIEGEVAGGDEDPARVVRRAVGCWAAVHGLAALREAGALAGIDAWLLPRPGSLARRLVSG